MNCCPECERCAGFGCYNNEDLRPVEEISKHELQHLVHWYRHFIQVRVVAAPREGSPIGGRGWKPMWVTDPKVRAVAAFFEELGEAAYKREVGR